MLGIATEEEGFDPVGVGVVVRRVDGVALIERLDGGLEEGGGGFVFFGGFLLSEFE